MGNINSLINTKDIFELKSNQILSLLPINEVHLFENLDDFPRLLQNFFEKEILSLSGKNPEKLETLFSKLKALPNIFAAFSGRIAPISGKEPFSAQKGHLASTLPAPNEFTQKQLHTAKKALISASPFIDPHNSYSQPRQQILDKAAWAYVAALAQLKALANYQPNSAAADPSAQNTAQTSAEKEKEKIAARLVAKLGSISFNPTEKEQLEFVDAVFGLNTAADAPKKNQLESLFGNASAETFGFYEEVVKQAKSLPKISGLAGICNQMDTLSNHSKTSNFGMGSAELVSTRCGSAFSLVCRFRGSLEVGPSGGTQSPPEQRLTSTQSSTSESPARSARTSNPSINTMLNALRQEFTNPSHRNPSRATNPSPTAEPNASEPMRRNVTLPSNLFLNVSDNSQNLSDVNENDILYFLRQYSNSNLGRVRHGGRSTTVELKIEPFACDDILRVCLAKIQSDRRRLFPNAPKGNSTKKVSENHSDLRFLAPPVKLLAAVQRDLFRKLIFVGSQKETTFKSFMWYMAKIVSESTQLLKTLKTAKTMEVLCRKKILEESVVRNVLPLLAEVASKSVENPIFDFSKVLSQLSSLATELDQTASSDLFAGGERPEAVLCGIKTAESLHTYRKDSKYEARLSIPGATHLVLNFSKNCRTDRNRDVLTISKESGECVACLSGCKNMWPQRPTFVSGNKLVLTFASYDKINASKIALNYGFKFTAFGFKLDISSSMWIFDLAASIHALIGKICNHINTQSTIAKNEKRLFKIMVPFFSKMDSKKQTSKESADPIDFIKDLGEMRPRTNAHDLHEKISKLAKRSVLDSIKVPSVEKLCYEYIAVSIEFLGLSRLAIKTAKADTLDGNDEFVKLLVRIWELSKELKSFVISEKQRLKQKMSEEIKGKNTPNVLEEICKPIREKIKFLKTLPPYGAKQKERHVLKLAEIVYAFICEPVTIGEIKRCVKNQQERAEKRALAFTTVAKLTSKSKNELFAVSLLNKFLGSEPHQHFSRDIEAAGVKLKNKVKKGFNDYLKALISLLKAENNRMTLIKAQSLANFAFDFSLRDTELLLKVDLQTILDNDLSNFAPGESFGDLKIDFLAGSIQRTYNIELSVLRLLNSENTLTMMDNPKNIIKDVIKLQSKVFKIFEKRFVQLAAEISEAKRVTGEKLRQSNCCLIDKNGQKIFYNDLLVYLKNLELNELPNEYFRVEEEMFHLLSTASIQMESFRLYNGVVSDQLLSFIPLASPRTHNVALNLLRTLYENPKETRRYNKARKRLFLETIFLKIGVLLVCPEIRPKEEVEGRLIGSRGVVTQRMAMDYVMLVRRLSLMAFWKQSILDFVKESVAIIPDVIDCKNKRLKPNTTETRMKELKIAFASLAVLGGFPNIFRSGGKVEKKEKSANAEKGVLVEINRKIGTCKVIFDSNRKRAIESDLSKLRPIAEVETPVHFSEELGALLPIFQGLFAIDSEPFKIKFASRKKQKTPLKAQKEKWSCAMCTFLNEDAFTLCAMCNSFKPKETPFQKVENQPAAKKMKGDPENVSDSEFIFGQLKFSAIKAICTLLENSKGVSGILGKKEFSNFFKIFVENSLTPTEMKDFYSLDSLESIQTRLLEKIYEKNKGFKSNKRKTNKLMSLEKLIPFSPYKHSQFNIPSHFDLQFSENCEFLLKGDDSQQLTSNDKTSRSSLCYCRGNCLIPILIRSFYFEVTVLKLGKLANKRFSMAIGLYREGISLTGPPGNSVSYAFLAKTGEIKHLSEKKFSRKTDAANEPKAKGQKEKEPNKCTKKEQSIRQQKLVEWNNEKTVVGCGYDIIKKLIYFTVNGKIVEQRFEGISARFYPMFWIEAPGTTIEANFGQKRYVFDFEGTLEKDYLKTLKSESLGSKLSPKEQKRREMAENLVEIMGHYPLDLCVMALERVNDDMQSAANWLLEFGWKELDRMGDALIDSFKQSEHQKSEEQRRTITEEEEDEIPLCLPQGREENNRQIASMYLLEEIENSAPLGIEEIEVFRRPEELIHSVSSSMEIDRFANLKSAPLEIEIGHILQISENADKIQPQIFEHRVRYLLGKTGMVAGIDFTRSSVLLEIYDENLAANFRVKVPVYCLETPNTVWTDPISELDSEKPDGKESYLTKFLKVSKATSILTIRKTVLSLLNDWTAQKPFDLNLFGGKHFFVNFLKLISAELMSTFDSSEDKIGMYHSSRALLKIKSWIVQLLKEEGSSQKERIGAQVTKEIFSNPQKLTEIANKIYSESKPRSLFSLLAQECIIHFVQAANNTPLRLIFTSPGHNPYEAHTKQSGRISIPGARALLISFDSKCHLSKDILTCLRFYKDEMKTKLIARYRGENTQDINHETYAPFIVPANHCYYHFSSSGDNNYWGYKFKVHPVDLRIDDHQALNCLNLELGCWLLDILLNDKSDSIERFMISLYDALSWYVSKTKTGSKLRGLQLLNRIMLDFQNCPVEKIPSFSVMEPLYNEVKKILTRVLLDDRNNIQSQLTQGFVELMAVMELVKTIKPRANSKGQKLKLKGQPTHREEKKSSDMQDEDELDPFNVGRMFLEVEKAEISCKNKTADMTKELKQRLEHFGHAFLLIPPNDKWREVFGKDPFHEEKAEDKAMRLVFSVYKYAFNEENKTLQKSLLRNLERNVKCLTYVTIRPQQALLEKVQEVSSITLRKSKYLLEEFRLEAKKIEMISSYHYLVADEVELPMKSPDVFCKPNPSDYSGYDVETFCVGFWLFADRVDAIPNAERVLLCKGVSRTFSSIFPLIVLTPRNGINVTVDSVEMPFLVSAKDNIVPSAKWTHVLVNCDSEKIDIYVDGEIAVSSKSRYTFLINNDPFFLGTLPFGVLKDGKTRADFKGKMLDVRYSSYSKSAEEIRQYFQKTKPQNPEDRACGLTSDYKPCPRLNIADLYAQPRISWTAEMDCQLIDMVNKTIDSNKIPPSPRAVEPNQSPAFSLDRDNPSIVVINAQTGSHRHISPAEIQRLAENANSASSQDLPISPGSERDFETIHEMIDDDIDENIDDDMDEFEEDDEGYSPMDFPALGNADMLYLDANKIEHTARDLSGARDIYPLIANLSAKSLKERFIAIRMLNNRLDEVLHLVDFSKAHLPWSLAHRISKIRYMVFYIVKYRIFTNVLDKTNTICKNRVQVNRPKATKARERGDSEGKKSVFGQIYRQLNFLPPFSLRYSGRTWRVNYVGEGGQDAGGLFRDSLSEMCDDLQKGNVPLFIKCPNGRMGYGNNQDKFIPAPSATSELCLSMFVFVGKLLGIAIRTRSVLNLDLPDVVWKPLVGKTVGRKDITAVDAGFVEYLESLENANKNMSAEQFGKSFPLTFTAYRSDGVEVELCEGGRSKDVTLANCIEYKALLEKMRLEESQLQVESIRKGLGAIVPVSLLMLFSEKELEFLVCGKRNIDIDFLKANTIYRRGTDEGSNPVKWLWEALAEFSQEDRQKFLRFVWGQSRLPLTSEDFNEKFVVSVLRLKSDESLPTSHTCFFSLDLPDYTQRNILKEKVLYAIRNCSEIDTDFLPRNADTWEEE